MSFQCLFKAPVALFCSFTVWSSTGTKVSFGSDTQQWQLAHLWSSYISCNQANSWSKPEKDQSTPLFFVVRLQNKMGVTIESSVWEPSPFLYIFIFVSCFFSIFLLPSKSSSSSSSSLFDHSNSSSFIPFQRNFLLLFSLASGNFIIAFFFFLKLRFDIRLCLASSSCEIGFLFSQWWRACGRCLESTNWFIMVWQRNKWCCYCVLDSQLRSLSVAF